VLQAVGIWDDDGLAPAAQPLLARFAAAADPEQALKALARLAERDPAAWDQLCEGRTMARPRRAAAHTLLLGIGGGFRASGLK
jgi:hypothetical protein